MRINSTIRKIILSNSEWLVHIIIPIFFIAVVFFFHPFRETFLMDSDEGLNLIKAALVVDGHQITGDVETDQPPLLSNLLAMIFRQTGQSVNIGRFTILMFSALLLGAAGMASQIIWGWSTSILVYFLLISLPYYLRLSVSVMIGQPSIALAMVALLSLLFWHQKRKFPWLVLAGLFMSLSLFMKLFTVILLPVFGFGLLVDEWTKLGGTSTKLPRGNKIKLFIPAFIFSVSLIVFSVVLTITMIDLQNIRDLIFPHLEYRSFEKVRGSINAELKSSMLLILLAFIGLGYSIRKKKWLALYPAAWALFAYFVFLGHNPIWYHHQMLITIPAAMLAAFGIYSIVNEFWKPNKSNGIWTKTLIFGGLVIIGALLGRHIPNITNELGNRSPSIKSYGLDPETGEMLILNKIQSLANNESQIVTDMPIFAFRAKISIPLELALVSKKSFQTGLLSEQDFIDIIERDNPQFVLINQYSLPMVRGYMENNMNYEEVITTKTYTQKSATLYNRIAP